MPFKVFIKPNLNMFMRMKLKEVLIDDNPNKWISKDNDENMLPLK